MQNQKFVYLNLFRSGNDIQYRKMFTNELKNLHED